MGFSVDAVSYDRFMGRYSLPLAPEFADFALVQAGRRVLDVGCGPGALTGELVERFGPSSVAAVDPSQSFVSAARERYPGVDFQLASAENLPFDDATFDAVLAQLVVHFTSEPVRALGEMKRVTRPGGIVAACVWDHAGGSGPLAVFWEAARSLDPGLDDESRLPGAKEGHLTQLFEDAGLSKVEDGVLSVEVGHASFEDWWEPFELGVGPAGTYTSGLEQAQRNALRETCRRMLPAGSFSLTARAWAARGVA